MLPVASLSKAITSICAAKLIDRGAFTFQTQIGELLPDFFAEHPPVDAKAAQITVAELVTQRSACWSKPSVASLTTRTVDGPFSIRLGITSAKMNPKWLARGPYGAWQIATEDYARFLGYFTGAGLLQTSFEDWPRSEVEKGEYYSLPPGGPRRPPAHQRTARSDVG